MITFNFAQIASVAGFVSLHMETYLMHWAHRIEDTNTLDVDEYYHLFDSPIVRTQLKYKWVFETILRRTLSQRITKRRLKRTSKKISKRTLTIKIIISTNINKL